MHDAPLREVLRGLAIRLDDLSRRSGVDPSYVSKQVRGERPMLRAVRRAVLDALDEKATAALPHVARLLRRHGENQAAEACLGLHALLAPDGGPGPDGTGGDAP